ncbi:hypothetical protein [Sediminispirochaeta bajacaliforniensis]|uniref:hypothetical protein n=1 Tax=Sediminispirochaeta bajacaliforniensis TaxID=148 RepID=UPI0003633483|nr:hypothetical protein [Sediminispirochaeta bajacaliforniensis]
MEDSSQTLIKSIIMDIQEETKAAHLFRKSKLPTLISEDVLPDGETKEAVVERFLTFLEENKETDIKLKEGKKDSYLYSSQYMSDSYADILVNTEEKDSAKMIADQVRRDSKLYPRATAKRLFKQSPFNLSDTELTATLTLMKEEREYSDIQYYTASNGEEYLYSQQSLTFDHAKYLTEWNEVGQALNP